MPTDLELDAAIDAAQAARDAARVVDRQRLRHAERWINQIRDPEKQREARAVWYREKARVEDANDVDRYSDNWRTRND